ncbi:curved DNA-binding protein CbpA [Prauserella sediminis]|uniref:Curved DNA-binding protein CbpA n=1 Tax=Prauserella sediminis TaxID=577680 RepID=A0A839XMU1_9PSEU|nr:hypothetical protein [Prauserella sediminis]MBB3663179.1 curved DNA-binding protein CbpA [Prauserella sediminis]
MDSDRRSEWSPAERAAYRRFVRDHHPDKGGDPEVFAAGLRRFRQRPRPDAEPVVFVARKRGLPRLWSALSARRRRKRKSRVI